MTSPNYGHGVDTDLVEQAAALKPLLAEHAARTESQRQVVPEVVDALEGAGLFDVMAPKRVGGLGATMATQLAVAAALGEACASTAWVQTLLNVSAWATARSKSGVGLFEPTDERARVCGVLAPNGTAAPTTGGYIVNGRWPFASGSFHAGWFTGGVLIHDASGQATGMGLALVPRRDFIIEDTWLVAGMCGTASNTVVLDGAFVPVDRLARVDDEAAPGGDPADLWPTGSVLTLAIIGPLLGAARACAAIVTEKAPRRAISYTTYVATVDSMVAVSEVARAHLDIQTAWLHACRAADYIDDVGAGAPRDLREEARLRGRCGYLTAGLRQAVDTLLNVAGAGSFASTSPLQRHWRDLNVGSRHAFLATNPSLEAYGRALFGLDPITPLV